MNNEDLNIFLKEKAKEWLVDIILKAIKGKIQGDPMDNLIDKLNSSIMDFSLNSVGKHFPELLGYAWAAGMYKGVEIKERELAKKKQIEELEKKKDIDKMYQ